MTRLPAKSVLIAVSLALVMGWTGARATPGAGAAANAIQADVSCEGAVDAVDALQILRSSAGLGVSAGCLQQAGDTDCSGYVNVLDALRILRFASGLNNPAVPGCTAIGDAMPLAGPVFVQVSLEQGQAVTVPILQAGGGLTAYSSGGAVFQLSFPADALLGEEQVTMTPVSAIQGLPMSGGLLAAVQIEPAGLVLGHPATLTIQLPEPPAGDVFTFGIDGAQFFLTPAAPGAGPADASSTVSIPVTKLGTLGAAQGTASDRQTQSQHPPTLSHNQLAQQIANIVATSNDTAAMEDALRQFYESQLSSNIGAMQTCEGANSLIVAFLRWDALIQTFQGGDPFANERQQIKHALADGFVACYNEAYESCAAHNLDAAVPLVKAYSILETILGESERVDSTKRDRCLTFELDMTSTICIDSTDCGAGFDVRTAISHLRFVLDLGGLGEIALTHATWSWTDPPCSGSASGEAMPVRARGLARKNPIEPEPQLNQQFKSEFRIGLRITAPVEHWHDTCTFDFGPVVTDHDETHWWDFFCAYHRDEIEAEDTEVACDRSIGSAEFRIEDWQLTPQAGARKDYVRTNESIPGAIEIASEETHLELTHTPE